MTPRINTRECWYAKEELLALAFERYFGLDMLMNVIDNTKTGTVSEHLFNIGKEKNYYTGKFIKGRLPKVTPDYRLGMPRVINVNGQEHDIIKTFDYNINNYRFLENRRWVFYIRKPNNDYYFEDPVNTVIANCIRLGDEVLELSNLKKWEQHRIERGLSKNDKYLFECSIKGEFIGNAGTIRVSSKSRQEQLEYRVNINYPIRFMKMKDYSDKLLDRVKIFFPHTSEINCGCPDQSLRVVKDEQSGKELVMCVHALAAEQEAKYGGRIRIVNEKLKQTINRLKRQYKDKVIIDKNKARSPRLEDLITMFSPLEQPSLPNGDPNPIFEQFNAYILHERYADELVKDYKKLSNWNKRMKREVKKAYKISRVDYELYNRYGIEIILDPVIQVLLIAGMDDLGKRYLDTCMLTGNIDRGKLITEGCASIKEEPVYAEQPQVKGEHIRMVKQPLPQASGLEAVIDLRKNITEKQLKKEKITLTPGFYKQRCL